ncbi:Xanthine phosphoribosyltransferase 1 [Haplosporangium sp. Z 27]|nr:Xanthine phosphoribosyltransferase 1 [Haplosporangium sp. Z 27]
MVASIAKSFIRYLGKTVLHYSKSATLYIIIACIFINLVIFVSIATYDPNPTSYTKPVERRQVIIPKVLRDGRQNPLSTPPSWMSDWIADKKLDPELINPLNVAIDLIYTWVNGSGPGLREMKEEYKELSPLYQSLKNITELSPTKTDEPYNKDRDTSKHRFRDNNELKYSLRSVAQYGAPGLIRKTFILATEVTDNVTSERRAQVPQWLDQEKAKGKVEIVPHSEVFHNKSFLPSFNSLSIESQMYHVPGLADVFIYLNDDVFFGKPLNAADFWTPLYGFVFHLESTYRIIPRVPFKQITSANVGEEESLAYTNSLLAKQFGARGRAYLAHIPHILSVPIMEEIEALWPEEFEKTSSHRFRGEELGQEIQVSFLLAHYVVERLRETQLESYWKYRLDKNQDGNLDWEERQQLVRMVDQFLELKKKEATVLPQFRNRTPSALDNHGSILSSVGIPLTGETVYLSSGMDEYPFMMSPINRNRVVRMPNNRQTFRSSYSPEPLNDRTCRIDIGFCLGRQFLNSSNPTVDASTGKGSVFERMAFTEYRCGDCLLHIIRRVSSSSGSNGYMPPDKNSEAYRQVSADLAKYNYVVGGSKYSFLQLRDGSQAEEVLNTLMESRDNQTFFCINDDVQDSPLIERRVRRRFSEFLKKRLPISSPWEKPDVELEIEPEITSNITNK